jgi:two-component system, LuxR family, sensor kinase FixL
MDWVTAVWESVRRPLPKSTSMSFEAAEIQSRSPNAGARSASTDLRKLTTALLVFGGYYLGAKIGFALTFQPHPVSVLWPPNSILVAALLLTPRRTWWLVLFAAFPAHLAAQLQSQVPLTMILCWFISNCCEALIGAGLARYLTGGQLRFNSFRSVGIFCVTVVFIGPFLSSFLDAAFVRWNHWGEGAYWELFRIRFTSNVLAALTVTPTIVTWGTTGIAWLRKTQPWYYLEASVLFLGLLSISFIVLYKSGSEADSALLFLPLLFVLWAAFRFGSFGASTAISIITFAAIWSAARGHGPFSAGSAEQNALDIQIFLIVLSVPLLFLAGVIEERAMTETELRESEERFRIVADAAPVLMWMSGLDKLCTFCNKAWLDFTGQTMEQELGDGWSNGLHPEDFEKSLKTYATAFDAREPFVMQYRLRHHDGEYRWITDHGVPRHDAQRNFLGYIGVCVDITDLLKKDEALHEFEERAALAALARKAAEEEARFQRSRIDLLGRVSLLGEMTASLAHELNQPLSAIITNAEAGMLFIDKGKADCGTLREILLDMAEDGRRAQDIIRAVRNTIKNGSAIRVRINLNDVVTGVAHMIQPDAAAHFCKVQTSLTNGLPVIEGDPVQIQQVLINLVGNAIDAMRETPVSNRKVELVTERNGDSDIRVSVRDYGVGIPGKAQERLFEQFFTTKEEGLGMGLAIVKSIIDAHGGKIAAENVEGGGARFYFTLPATNGAMKK